MKSSGYRVIAPVALVFCGLVCAYVSAGDGGAEKETKWGPALSEGELDRIAKLPVEELADLVQRGSVLQAEAALSVLKAEEGWKRNFDLLLDLAKGIRGDMIVEGLVAPVAGSGPDDDKQRVDKFLMFLEDQLRMEKPSVSGVQAVRSIAQTVHVSDAIFLQEVASEPPYATARVLELLLKCLEHPEWQVRRAAVGWLGVLGPRSPDAAQKILVELERRKVAICDDAPPERRDMMQRTVEQALRKFKRKQSY